MMVPPSLAGRRGHPYRLKRADQHRASTPFVVPAGGRSADVTADELSGLGLSRRIADTLRRGRRGMVRCLVRLDPGLGGRVSTAVKARPAGCRAKDTLRCGAKDVSTNRP